MIVESVLSAKKDPDNSAEPHLLAFLYTARTRIACVLLLFLVLLVAYSFQIYGTALLEVDITSSILNSTAIAETPSESPTPIRGPDPLADATFEEIPVWHNLTDEQLFLHASSMPLSPHLYHNRTKKIALLFLTRGPLPFTILWERWLKAQHGYYSVYVHPKPGFKYGAEVADVFKGREIPSQEVSWGTVSIVDAERRLLANALLDADNQRFVLLSEACIPLWNFTYVYHYLMDTNVSFLASFDDPGPHGRGRYNPNMWPEIEREQWRKGSQWFEFTREVSRNVVADTKYYPKILWFCVPTCYSDEHYFPTMLSLIHEKDLAYRSITSVDWGGGGAHPKSYQNVEMNKETIVRMRGEPTCVWNDTPNQPCFLFGRKLEPNTRGRLMILARFMGF